MLEVVRCTTPLSFYQPYDVNFDTFTPLTKESLFETSGLYKFVLNNSRHSLTHLGCYQKSNVQSTPVSIFTEVYPFIPEIYLNMWSCFHRLMKSKTTFICFSYFEKKNIAMGDFWLSYCMKNKS